MAAILITTDYFNDLFCIENLTMKDTFSRKKERSNMKILVISYNSKFCQFLQVNENYL